MKTVLITGGTGLIGKALTNMLLSKGYKIIIVSRNAGKFKKEEQVDYVSWDLSNQQIDTTAITKADYIVHLAGAGVADKRWSPKRKEEIVRSRVQSSSLLVKALKETDNHVRAVISASGIGWYGADPTIPNPRPFVETDPASKDFLGDTCVKWEESIAEVRTLNKRLVILRTGIVLSNEGGALKEFRKSLYFGVASILSTGRQIVSWIHIDDLIRMYVDAIENDTLEGIYNAVAPKPISNKELTLQLAKVMKGNFYVPMHVPAFALTAMLGELSVEVLKSTTVSANKIRKTGFNFIYPSIEPALTQLG
ncbi:MAG: TIGR01777 family protein [Chitinophagaceae bacterium]|nr:TIGR01777 family protein [Chitinophagaceae bacterium]